MLAESVLLWITVSLYAVGAAVFVVGSVFERQAWPRAAMWISVAGLLPHLIAIGARWVRVGHGPYLGFFEVVSALALTSVLVLGIMIWRGRGFEVLGAIIMPISVVMMGAAILAPRSDSTVTPALVSWWLVIHIAFAMLAYAALLVSFALGIAYLLRDGRRPERWAALLDQLPDQEELDSLSFRFVSVGFIFQAMMIAAGAIWANEAWGRYWGWDPIETWSLVSWLVYAGYMHARLALGWRGRRSAWFAVVGLLVVVFALIGVPILYKSVHSAYLELK